MSVEAPTSVELQSLQIARLHVKGHGVARVGDVPWHVANALPGETVLVERRKARRRGAVQARVVEVVSPSADRVSPPCPVFGLCGGCVLQHMQPAAQRAWKQARLADHFEAAGLTVPRWLPPLHADDLAYRGRARLGVKHVPAKGGCLVGFRERMKPGLVTNMQACAVLAAPLGEMIADFRVLIGSLHAKAKVPQLEVMATGVQLAMVIRHLIPLDDHDVSLLCDFAKVHGIVLYLQPGGLDSVHCVHGEGPLCYRLHDQQLTITFAPGDFTQSHFALNQAMVNQVLAHLNLQPHHSVLDLCCGVGNFSLPIAQRCARVLGVELAPQQVERARQNAVHNGLLGLAFEVADLCDPNLDAPWLHASYDRVLIDPPRTGALAMMPRIAAMAPERVVYVACSVETLARDAAVLVSHGYRLQSAGIIDMFPHTRHVESMAVFERRQ